MDLESIDDPRERAALESQISEFGQCPSLLFAGPHPRRDDVLAPVALAPSIKQQQQQQEAAGEGGGGVIAGVEGGQVERYVRGWSWEGGDGDTAACFWYCCFCWVGYG